MVVSWWIVSFLSSDIAHVVATSVRDGMNK